MSLSRRNAIISLGMAGAGLALGSSPARANLATDNWSALQPILARHWKGFCQTKTANTVSGGLTLRLEVDFAPSDDMRIDGRLRMTSRWDTGTYSAIYRIQGYCWGTDEAVGVLIESTSFASGDSLPDELYWQGLTGQLRLYPEKDAQDHWLLSGDLSGTRDGNRFEALLTDRAIIPGEG